MGTFIIVNYFEQLSMQENVDLAETLQDQSRLVVKR